MNAIHSFNRSARNTTEIINAVARMHAHSLAAYLVNARPTDAQQYPDVMATIQHMAQDHEETVARLDDLQWERGVKLDRGGFPMEFTSLHDLSMCYLLQRLVDDQRRNLADLERYVAALRSDPQAQAVVEETLGAAKAHLDALQDCQAG